MRIVLLGAPGSGKGTQAQRLVARYPLAYMATGDLLRAEVAAGTPLGKQARELIEQGEFVPDEIVLNMIMEHLAKDDTSRGFILDGFPRNRRQAEALDGVLKKESMPLDRVLFLDVDYGEIMKRLLARRRADDTEEVIRHRLEVYEAQTAPLIDYYRQQGILRTIQGVGSIAAISERIVAIPEELRPSSD